MITTRVQRRKLKRNNDKMSSDLLEVPRSEWPDTDGLQRRVWRSRHYLVQEFDAPAPADVRLCINRTTLSGDQWEDNITWDELQNIKSQCGYSGAEAVEVYPPDHDVVNVANMRHLWILREQMPFTWKRITGADAVSSKMDVERMRTDAERYRKLRDGQNWPAVFASHDAPEPLRGVDLDAACDGAVA